MVIGKYVLVIVGTLKTRSLPALAGGIFNLLDYIYELVSQQQSAHKLETASADFLYQSIF
jgi:hypothetical protein